MCSSHLSIEEFPFTEAERQRNPDLDDPAFRYEPNRLCEACRALLRRGLSLYGEYGIKMCLSIHTSYTLGALEESAQIGCHMCALLKGTFRPREPIPSEEPVVLFVQHVQPTLAVAHNDNIAFRMRLKMRYGEYSYLAVQMGVGEGRAQAIRTGYSEPSLGRWTGDEETFGVVRKWLDQCLAEHALCAQNDDEARVVKPARLLAIKEENIKLINSDDAGNQYYVTLSHCWGAKSDIPRLLHNTMAKFRAGIDVADLPKTFQDAITICKKLKFQYIWIDSLCIIQDSLEDWKVQAKSMALVYANSTLTIAALKSSGSDGGCFTDERHPLCLRDIYLDDPDVLIFDYAKDKFGIEVDVMGYNASPLHSRSWVVQERLSSPRTVLYGSSGVFWECRCSQASESCYRTLPWYSKDNKKTWLQRLALSADALRRYLPPINPTAHPDYAESWFSHWNQLLTDYSSCALTKETDKLIAVTGLLSEIERRSQPRKRGVLGLWVGDGRNEDENKLLLLRTMLWYRRDIDKELTPRLQNGMPTWTWASVEGRCSCMITAGELEWQTPIEIDAAAVPATMKLNTWRRKVLLDQVDDSLWPQGFSLGLHADCQCNTNPCFHKVAGVMLDPNDPKTSQKGWGGDLDQTYTWYPDCSAFMGGLDLFIVLVQRKKITDNPQSWVSWCLLITPDKPASDTGFIRVGLVVVRFSNPRDDPFKSQDNNAREIVFLR